MLARELGGFVDDDADAPAREWLSLGQASALLGVSQSTVRRWADAGELRSFRTSGGHRRIRAEDARLFLTRGGQTAAPLDTDRISELSQTHLQGVMCHFVKMQNLKLIMCHST